MLEVKGLNSLTFGFSKDDAETTDFFSAGWSEHLPAERAKTLTAEGYKLQEVYPTYQLNLGEADGGTFLLGNNQDGWTDPIPWDADGLTIEGELETLYGAANVVSVEANDDFTILFDKDFKARLDADFSELENAVSPFIIPVASAEEGERDPGQERIEELDGMHDDEGLGEFDLTSPGGQTKQFFASVNLQDIGGSNNEATSWGVELTLNGETTKL